MPARYLNRLLRLAGYELRRTAASDVQDLRRLDASRSPLAAIYASPFDRFVVDVPIDMIVPTRMMRAWCEVLRAYETRGEAAGRDVLRAYFANLQPVDVAEYLRLSARLAWRREHPLSYVYPWEETLPQVRMEERIRLMRAEAEQNGLHWQASDGWKGFGPVSERLLDMELGRLTRTFDSIRQRGFEEDQGQLLGRVFCAGNTQMVQPQLGWHRMAACLAVGMTTVPMMFDRRHPVVRREDAHDWPQVRRGLFSFEEAVQVFDDRFAASGGERSHREASPLSPLVIS